jgi:diacylglycerol kinase
VPASVRIGGVARTVSDSARNPISSPVPILVSMDRFKSLTWPAYLTIALLVLFPVVDAVLTIWPFRVGEVAWRFGAVGIFSRALMTPLFALVLAYALALLLEQRIMQRVISIVSVLGSLALLSASIFFMLDSLQMRSQVQEQMRTAFDVASTVALIKIVVVGLVAMLLGIMAFRASRRPVQSRRATARVEAPIIVGAGVRADS